jgi:hypothetical protein
LDITIHQLISGNCILAVNASTTLLACAFCDAFCDVTSKKAHDLLENTSRRNPAIAMYEAIAISTPGEHYIV